MFTNPDQLKKSHRDDTSNLNEYNDISFEDNDSLADIRLIGGAVAEGYDVEEIDIDNDLDVKPELVVSSLKCAARSQIDEIGYVMNAVKDDDQQSQKSVRSATDIFDDVSSDASYDESFGNLHPLGIGATHSAPLSTRYIKAHTHLNKEQLYRRHYPGRDITNECNRAASVMSLTSSRRSSAGSSVGARSVDEYSEYTVDLAFTEVNSTTRATIAGSETSDDIKNRVDEFYDDDDVDDGDDDDRVDAEGTEDGSRLGCSRYDVDVDVEVPLHPIGFPPRKAHAGLFLKRGGLRKSITDDSQNSRSFIALNSVNSRSGSSITWGTSTGMSTSRDGGALSPLSAVSENDSDRKGNREASYTESYGDSATYTGVQGTLSITDFRQGENPVQESSKAAPDDLSLSSPGFGFVGTSSLGNLQPFKGESVQLTGGIGDQDSCLLSVLNTKAIIKNGLSESDKSIGPNNDAVEAQELFDRNVICKLLRNLKIITISAF